MRAFWKRIPKMNVMSKMRDKAQSKDLNDAINAKTISGETKCMVTETPGY